MIADWMMHATIVSLLLSLAAASGERASRQLGLPTRWVWVGAILGSVALPVAWLAAYRPGVPSTGLAELAQIRVHLPLVSEAGASSPVAALAWLDPLLIAIWSAASVGMLLMLVRSHARLRRREGRWPAAQMQGRTVRVSDDVGPAVLGVVRPRLVIPSWLLAAPDPIPELVLAHEVQHVRARDPQLLILALSILLILPWNLPLWWQIRRLRLAVEVDCDARVLRAGADPHAYGSLLVRVGRFRATGRLPLLALVEMPSFLERRIRMLIDAPRRKAPVAALPALLLAGAFALAACGVERPDSESAEDQTPEDVAREAAPAGAEEPRFTPYDEPPELSNTEHAAEALERLYPPALRVARVGGRTVLWLRLDEEGRVTTARVAQSSGRAELDEAAETFAHELRFRPARNQGEQVAVWVQLPVVFRP